MSAVTLAVLRDARAAAQPHHSPEAIAYVDLLQKAPRAIAAAHLASVAARLLALAGRVTRRGVGEYAASWRPRTDVRGPRT